LRYGAAINNEEGAMHLSKSVLYIGIIAYSAAILFLQDWGDMVNTLGLVSAAFLGKMLIDIGFCGAGAIRLVGPAFFATDEDDDEVGIHEEDLQFSDTALYGLFFVDVLANAGWHGYVTTMTNGAMSFAYSIWVIIEAFALFFTFILWRHAIKVQKRVARKAREAAKAAATREQEAADRGAATMRRVS
jgi:hypothetical protein